MTHFLQSQYWRDIKEELGNKTFDAGKVWFQTTKVPGMDKFIGYIPRANLEDIDWGSLYKAGQEANCVYISIDPVNLKTELTKETLRPQGDRIAFEKGIPTHLQENAVIDISLDEETLLANMKQKHRYNLKLAQKNNLEVKINSSEEMFEEFLKLYSETASRQKYFGRSETYLRTVWNTLRQAQSDKPLVAIATVYFEGKPLSSWFLFLFEDTIYYPYGGSNEEHKNLMATYLLVWELIKWGKEHGFKNLDLWGIEQESVSGNVEPVYDGFSRFKLGFGGNHLIYEDTIDLVIEKNLYNFLKAAQNLRERFSFIKKVFS